LAKQFVSQVKVLKNNKQYEEAIRALLTWAKLVDELNYQTRQLYPQKQWRRRLQPPYSHLTRAILDSYHSIEWYLIKLTEKLLLNGVSCDAINEILQGTEYKVERGSSSAFIYRNGHYLWHIPVRFT
jgi:hypothetical protein